jgi:hypothetical protein
MIAPATVMPWLSPQILVWSLFSRHGLGVAASYPLRFTCALAQDRLWTGARLSAANGLLSFRPVTPTQDRGDKLAYRRCTRARGRSVDLRTFMQLSRASALDKAQRPKPEREERRRP